MQWSAVFFGVYRGRFAPAAPEKTWRGKRTIPQRGGWGVGQNFYGCQDFLLLPLNVKKNKEILGKFGGFKKSSYLCTTILPIALHSAVMEERFSIMECG